MRLERQAVAKQANNWDRELANLASGFAKSLKNQSEIKQGFSEWRSLAESNRSLHRERVAS
jgi:hypothetical protein